MGTLFRLGRSPTSAHQRSTIAPRHSVALDGECGKTARRTAPSLSANARRLRHGRSARPADVRRQGEEPARAAVLVLSAEQPRSEGRPHPGIRPADRVGRIVERIRGAVAQTGIDPPLAAELQRAGPAGTTARVVCRVSSRPPCPHFSVVREPPGNALAAWGPDPRRKRLAEAVRRLNDAFRLHNCEKTQAIHFSEQRSLFPIVRPAGCLRFEIGTCSGPCVEGTTRLDYARQVRSARAFLDGRDGASAPPTRKNNDAAATNCEYERAAAVRDKLDPVALARRTARLAARHATIAFVRLSDHRRRRPVALVRHRPRPGPATIAAPHHAASRAAALKLLTAAFERRSCRDCRSAITWIPFCWSPSWFRRRPEERGRLMLPDEAIDRCRQRARGSGSTSAFRRDAG